MTNYNNIDRVSIGLGKRTAVAGLAALLQSCATFNEDVYASRPEVFERAYSPRKTPKELEGQVADMKKTLDGIKGVNSALEKVANTATGATTAAVEVQSGKQSHYDPSIGVWIIGSMLLASAITTYILWPPKEKNNES